MSDYTYWGHRDGKFIEVPDIDKLCLALKDKFLRQEEENVHLRDEIKKLKDGIWEKEELKRLKDIEKKYHRSFEITENQEEKINNWISAKEKKYTGAIGGRYEYRFFPTGIGTIGKIVDTITHEEFIFSDSSDW